MTARSRTIDWVRASARPAPHFPWPEVRAAHDAMDPHVARAAITIAQEDHPDARPCHGCATAPEELAWISIGTSDALWNAGDERCGWLTVCARCGEQVELLLDPEMIALRRDGNW